MRQHKSFRACSTTSSQHDPLQSRSWHIATFLTTASFTTLQHQKVYIKYKAKLRSSTEPHARCKLSFGRIMCSLWGSVHVAWLWNRSEADCLQRTCRQAACWQLLHSHHEVRACDAMRLLLQAAQLRGAALRLHQAELLKNQQRAGQQQKAGGTTSWYSGHASSFTAAGTARLLEILTKTGQG